MIPGIVMGLRSVHKIFVERRIMETLRKIRRVRGGFSLIEIITVILILSIAALMAVPMFSSAANVQVRTAANVIAADLEYAKNLAITTQEAHFVTFNTATEAYDVRKISDTANPIGHPTKSGAQFVTELSTDTRTSKVDIVTADFDAVSNNTITFDYLGGPYSGQGTASPLNSGTITLESEGFTMTVTVEPITGYITVQ